MSNDDYMGKYLDPWIIFVSKHGIQKLTIHLPDSRIYEFPYGIMTCSSLTHLEVFTFGVFKPSDCVKFPNLVSLKLVCTQIESKLLEDTLILPMLETLTLIDCRVFGRMRLVAPKLENLTIDDIDIENLNPIVTSIKHLSLDGSSLKTLAELFHVPADRLALPQNLQTLKICDLTISVEQFPCALILLRGSSNLYELDLSVAVQVEESDIRELSSYLSKAESHLNEALRMIQKMRVKEFKGSRAEMYLIKLLLAHSPKLEKMIVEQFKNFNSGECIEHLKELISFPRASTKAVIKYL
ncbi:F-box/FBD/LRR-repeat protein At1g13570-like [Nicotiana tomentosiformis]|uniref:F-box/FBD/LRR-repeat protein At1g13570-like n=1 Tax=Nicotiana tomentosiformis TaxID=4098 RepID=UPI0008789727|nr:uncharacterized protein LOC104118861 [Nicotiana tomentosiformis]